MKNFQFEDIYLISHRDQRARKEQFHPKRNLLVGRNHTGKSSLIKNLFITLGATPKGRLSDWSENTVSLVTFSIDGRSFSVLHQMGNRALFDKDKNLLIVTGSHSEWSNKFAEITDFNLPLTDRKGNTLLADSACFLLPFYINQDGSWQAEWNTFYGVQRYKTPNKAILEYFSGIKPPDYYKIQAMHKVVKSKLDDLLRELVFLERAKERLSKSLVLNGPKLNNENFEVEIESLTEKVSELNSKQEGLREKLVREKEVVDSVELQIRLSSDALKTYELDEKYLQDSDRENLICPTCGAEHVDSFIDILAYSEDGRILRELLTRLRKDKDRALKEYNKSKGLLDELEETYCKISKILETKKGELEFKDVVESAGSEKAFRAFLEEEQSLKGEIEESDAELAKLDREMKSLVNRKRSKDILDKFRQSYASSRIKLNLPSVNTKRIGIAGRPNVSGSGGPRSILAYYSALWDVCSSEDYGSYVMPIVIDSPNQQAQDDINLPMVLNFIANSLPEQMQLIVSSETDAPELDFDKKIELTEPYRLLSESDFGGLAEEIEPLLQEMYRKL